MIKFLERLERKIDIALQALHLLLQKEIHMSATTDAIKADLVALDAKVDSAIAAKASADQSAIASEEADVAEIKTTIEAISTKVDQLVPAASAPAPSVDVGSA